MTSGAPRVSSPERDIVIVHSSDLHVDHDYTARMHGGDVQAGVGRELGGRGRLGAEQLWNEQGESGGRAEVSAGTHAKGPVEKYNSR